ncbi:hypothetical protein [Mesorhizobium sp. WSM4906]|uniref:hypothetical protein n=1 Tax=Mesorhizobium sp. WSM4906 TaxID=3038546 RepID=UPI0024168ADB|nr:hypothetical protein [Mesorhizobium sp. WSM4906]WFP79105.1 hypothetical protein QAZ22_15445 [Mesorhizobium sp. WSM4906]
MPVFDTVLTMSMGKRLADFSVGGAAAPMTYALASQTLGQLSLTAVLSLALQRGAYSDSLMSVGIA